MNVGFAGWGLPLLLHSSLLMMGQLSKPISIELDRHASGSPGQLALSQPLDIVGAAINQLMQEGVAVFRYIFDFIAHSLHSLEEAYERGRRIQPDCVANTIGFAGGVGQHEHNSFVGVRFVAEASITHGKFSDSLDTVGNGHVT